MISPKLWVQLWERAEREELGLIFRTSNSLAFVYVSKFRPPGFEDYTVCRTPDPYQFAIVKPNVTMDDILQLPE